jgi:outer membrane murein-binding lipoprotein Lpp
MFSNDNGSASANAKFDAIMTDVLTKWAQSDDGRRILREGRHIAAWNAVREIRADIAKLETQLKAKRAELRRAERTAASNPPALACESMGSNHSADRAMVGIGSQDGPRLMCGFHASQL